MPTIASKSKRSKKSPPLWKRLQMWVYGGIVFGCLTSLRSPPAPARNKLACSSSGAMRASTHRAAAAARAPFPSVPSALSVQKASPQPCSRPKVVKQTHPPTNPTMFPGLLLRACFYGGFHVKSLKPAPLATNGTEWSNKRRFQQKIGANAIQRWAVKLISSTRTYVGDVDEGRALLRGSARRGGGPLHLEAFLLQNTRTGHLDGNRATGVCGLWPRPSSSGSHLVLGADFGGLGDFAPGGPRGLLHPGYRHGWLSVSAEEKSLLWLEQIKNKQEEVLAS